MPPPRSAALLSASRPFQLRLNAGSAAQRQWQTCLTSRNRRATYSTDSGNSGPLVRVTDLPAPNTGHIRVLELNRPSARNAISRALLTSLREEVDAVHAQYDAATGDELAPASWNKRFGGVAGADAKGPTRALVLASAVDTSFCAGADLKERKGFSQEECVKHHPSPPAPTFPNHSVRNLGKFCLYG